MRTLTCVVVALALLLIATGQPAEAGRYHMKAYTVDASFADVRQDVLDAIVNRGFVLDFEARISDMLKRTEGDIGAKTSVYSDATMLMFCSAKYSRDAMIADPMNIVFCPYVINVFTLADKPGTVHVAYRRPFAGGSLASRKALLVIEELLDGIAREAAGQ